MVKFFHLDAGRRWNGLREEQRMDRQPPVDEVRAPGFIAGLTPRRIRGGKSKDQRIPSGHAIARTLPPNKQDPSCALAGKKLPGDRESKAGNMAAA
jgi:hypothetical protein